MQKKAIITLSCLLLILLAFIPSDEKNQCTIRLRYTLNYEGDTWEKNRTGFLWTLSYLGANLPKGSFDSSLTWTGPHTFLIDFNKLGFSEHAIRALQVLCDSLKATPAYRKTKALDLGRFIALTLGSSWHYYAITNVPRSYNEFLKQAPDGLHEVFALTRSTVSHHHRLIRSLTNGEFRKSVFIAEEGEGDVRNRNFSAKEFEVMDILQNGQLRFAVYNANGDLIPAGDKQLGESGKPAKCIWCHEISIQPLFTPADSVPGFLSPHQFTGQIIAFNDSLKNYRSKLNGDIDFTRLQDHTYQELIYISFMEPSLKRLSQEWGISEKALKKILRTKTTHIHHEFSFLGDLFNRNNINSEGPDGGKLPGSIREESEAEPDYTGMNKH